MEFFWIIEFITTNFKQNCVFEITFIEINKPPLPRASWNTKLQKMKRNYFIDWMANYKQQNFKRSPAFANFEQEFQGTSNAIFLSRSSPLIPRGGEGEGRKWKRMNNNRHDHFIEEKKLIHSQDVNDFTYHSTKVINTLLFTHWVSEKGGQYVN